MVNGFIGQTDLKKEQIKFVDPNQVVQLSPYQNNKHNDICAKLDDAVIFKIR